MRTHTIILSDDQLRVLCELLRRHTINDLDMYDFAVSDDNPDPKSCDPQNLAEMCENVFTSDAPSDASHSFVA